MNPSKGKEKEASNTSIRNLNPISKPPILDSNASKPTLARTKPLVKDYLASSSSSSSNSSSTEDDSDIEDFKRDQDQVIGGGYGLREQDEFERKSPRKSLKKLAKDPFGRSHPTLKDSKSLTKVRESNANPSREDIGKGKGKQIEPTTPASKANSNQTRLNHANSLSSLRPSISTTPRNPISEKKPNPPTSSKPTPRQPMSRMMLIKETPPPEATSSTTMTKPESRSGNGNNKTKLSAFSASRGLDLSPLKNRNTTPLTSHSKSLVSTINNGLRGPESEAKDEMWMRSKDQIPFGANISSSSRIGEKRSREEEEEDGDEKIGSHEKKKLRDVLDIGSWALARSPSERDGKSKWVK